MVYKWQVDKLFSTNGDNIVSVRINIRYPIQFEWLFMNFVKKRKILDWKKTWYKGRGRHLEQMKILFLTIWRYLKLTAIT